jgi:TRAP-type C4-dicarboxylate transport system permease small subunit
MAADGAFSILSGCGNSSADGGAWSNPAMKRVVHKINQILSGFCGWLMLSMMILLVIDIITRTMRKPIQGMAELSVFVMMVVIYLGLARCEEHKEHVNLEIVLNALPPLPRRIMEIFSYLLALGTVGLLLYAVFTNALNSYLRNEAIEGTVEMHIWPVKFIMVVGLIFFFAQTLINTLGKTKKLKPSKDKTHSFSSDDLF